MSKKHYIIPIFIPHQGCPHQCVFCNQRQITGKMTMPGAEEVLGIIEEYLNTMPKGEKLVEVAFYGGSFTGLETEWQEQYLSLVQPYLRRDIVDGIRISTRPDYICDQVIDILQSYSVKTVELGVQSLDEEVLLKANRGHTVEDVHRAVLLLKRRGLQLGLQMMVGLPGDSPEKSVQTAQKITDLRPDFVRVYPVLVIENTPLAEEYIRGKYQPWPLPKTVEVCKSIATIFAKANIPIIRMGLQASEEINSQAQVLAGPFHPAFGELVESAMAKDKLKSLLLNSNRDLTDKTVIFSLSPQDESIARGQRNASVNELTNEFRLKTIRFHKDASLPRKTFLLQGIE